MKNLETYNVKHWNPKTHSKYNIPEELWGNWPTKEEADIACGCKESTRIGERTCW
jgi:hypothetical protein